MTEEKKRREKIGKSDFAPPEKFHYYATDVVQFNAPAYASDEFNLFLNNPQFFVACSF